MPHRWADKHPISIVPFVLFWYSGRLAYVFFFLVFFSLFSSLLFAQLFFFQFCIGFLCASNSINCSIVETKTKPHTKSGKCERKWKGKPEPETEAASEREREWEWERERESERNRNRKDKSEIRNGLLGYWVNKQKYVFAIDWGPRELMLARAMK